jgi:hypothetical protein
MRGIPKPPPRAIAKATKRREEADALREAYADVDARDAGMCWITGRYTQPGAVDARVRREHHHLRGRNVCPERVTQPWAVITVCAEAHQLITRGLISVEGDDARHTIRFHWNGVPLAQRPFVIRSRRWSQERDE